MLKDQGETDAQVSTHPHPFYTPIATFGSLYELEPVACGMKFVGAFSGATLVSSDLSSTLQTAGVNATAYAARLADGRHSVIVLNKDAQKDLTISLRFGGVPQGRVEIHTLSAPSLTSREAHISRGRAGGILKKGSYMVAVPRASGVRVTVG